MNKQLGKKILLVLAAVMVMILLSSFKMQNEGDRSFKKIVLNKNKSVEYTVDVGKMGLLKYWLEPNVFSVALRCQTEDDTLKLRCETEGVDVIISQGSKKGIWKKLKSEDVLVKRSKNTVPINLEIAVPSKNIYRRNVQEGKIKIWNQDELYSVINLKIVNSRSLSFTLKLTSAPSLRPIQLRCVSFNESVQSIVSSPSSRRCA